MMLDMDGLKEILVLVEVSEEKIWVMVLAAVFRDE
jgi:hypothetical protein